MQSSNSISRRHFFALSGAAACGMMLAGVLEAHGAEAPAKASAGDFLLPAGLAYLNCGSLGPTPRSVMEAAQQAWMTLEQNPVEQGYGPLEQQMEAVRGKAAAFLGCKLDEMALTHSTTDGMNTIAQGLGLVKGQRVLTSDQEHPGGRLCWDYYARRYGVNVDVAAIPVGLFDPRAIVDRFAAKLTPETKVISVSHVTFTTGLQMPIRALAELARAHGCLLVVDGAQAVGGVNVNVKALNCHAYAASGHKWLLGPAGTGLLYLSEETGAAIDSLVLQSGRAAYTGATGVRDIPAVIGLGAALDFFTTRGAAVIAAHAQALRNRLYAGLQALPALTIASPPPGQQATPLLSFILPEKLDNAKLAAILRDRYRITVKVLPHNVFNGLRIATHTYNTEDDIDRLLEALGKEIK